MSVVIDRMAPEGNAVGIMARVKKELELIGRGDDFPEYEAKAKSGDYDNLCRVSMEYVPWLRFIDDTIETDQYEIVIEEHRILKPSVFGVEQE